MKVLNLYSGLGGNRKLWKDVEVTAVEIDSDIAKVYSEFFPGDHVVVGDAHEYLLRHYDEYDFIWTSPPCPSHGRSRYWNGKLDAVYPDWHLWQEIIFLKYFTSVPYVVENVVPYYENDLFIMPTIKLQRHLFWSNFKIRRLDFDESEDVLNIKPTATVYGFNIADKKIGHRKDQLLRNLVNPEIGLYLLEQAKGINRENQTKQIALFN